MWQGTFSYDIIDALLVSSLTYLAVRNTNPQVHHPRLTRRGVFGLPPRRVTSQLTRYKQEDGSNTRVIAKLRLSQAQIRSVSKS